MQTEDGGAPTESRPIRVIADRYELLEPLGAGGFGTVYKALDRRLQRLVALKLHRSGASMHPHARERFLREARAAARLQHPNVVAIYDATEDGQDVFLVLELVQGRSLLEMLRREPVTIPAAINIVTAVARALGAAHKLGIIHRDIKPANILVADDGTVKVADFGIARFMDETEITREGAVVGTPKYMSPEQLEGKNVGATSDLYSLGCVAYELVAGTPPYPTPRPLPDNVRTEAPQLATTIEHLLRPRPAARPQSAEEVVERLSAVKPRTSQPTRLSIAVVAVLAAIVIGAAVFAIIRAQRARGPASRATIARTIPVKNAGVYDRLKSIGTTSGDQIAIDIAGLSFFVRRAGNGLIVRSTPETIDAAAQVVTLHDALFQTPFAKTPNVFTGEKSSQQEVAVKSYNLAPHRLIEVLAAAARWPVVFDASAEREVMRHLGGAKAPDVAVTAPWDQVAKTLIDQYGLETQSFENVWLLASQERCRQLDRKRRRTAISFFTLMNLDDAARAFRAASSEGGTVLVNKRLSSLIVNDYVDVLLRQQKILDQLDGVTRPAWARRFAGLPVSVHLRNANIRDLIARMQKFTGINAIVAPEVQGTVSMTVQDVPWDEALEVGLVATGNTYALRNGVLEITKDVEREEPVVVETVKLRREDPEFFAAWKESVSPRGSIVIDRNARLLIIRDTRSNATSMRKMAEHIDSEMSQITRMRMAKEIRERGLAAGIALQQRLKATNRDFDLDETNWNELGYFFLQRGEKKLALQVFEKNVADHPQSANAYDSLAEAQLAMGMRDVAIRNYRRSLELNPENVSARNALRKLGAGT